MLWLESSCNSKCDIFVLIKLQNYKAFWVNYKQNMDNFIFICYLMIPALYSWLYINQPLRLFSYFQPKKKPIRTTLMLTPVFGIAVFAFFQKRVTRCANDMHSIKYTLNGIRVMFLGCKLSCTSMLDNYTILSYLFIKA